MDDFIGCTAIVVSVVTTMMIWGTTEKEPAAGWLPPTWLISTGAVVAYIVTGG